MPSILDRLRADLKTSMKARDAEQTDAIRMAISAMKYKQDRRNGRPCPKKIKKKCCANKSSSATITIEQYSKAGRMDLADKESPETRDPDGILAEGTDAGRDSIERRRSMRALPEGAKKFPEAIKAAMAA